MSKRVDLSDYLQAPESSASQGQDQDQDQDHHDGELPLYRQVTETSSGSSYREPPDPFSDGGPQSPLTPLTPSFTSPAKVLDPDAPPLYSLHDTQAQSFSLRGSLIYSESPSYTPRFQLSQRLTKTGKPYQLRVRRLLTSESRRLSLPANGKGKGKEKQRVLDYDDETTMYIITNPSILSGLKGAVEIKGCRSSCVRGAVHMEVGTRLKGKVFKFVHVTRNATADYLLEENEKRMQKYGYRASEEWNRELLFTLKPDRKGLRWIHADGRVIAIDDEDGFRLQGNETGEVERQMRDLLVTCWTAKNWVVGNVCI